MAQNTASQQLYDLLVGKNFDLTALDSQTNQPPINDEGKPDNSKADKFVFDYVASSGKNYGTVVVYVNSKDLTLMFGDNVGKTMEGQDKTDWFNFMYQLKQLGTKNFLNFQPENINKEKYVRQSQAAITESWQGKGNMSWNGQPTEARLVIKHKKNLGEGEARFRYIESIYIETADSERFKLKSRSLTAAKAMLEHVRQGGNPYDARAQHINEIVEELSVLSRFRRANAGRILEGDTKNLVEQTDAYYKNMHSVLKHLGTSRGYQGYFESWNPTEVNEGNLVVEDLKQLFVEQTIDHRIEEALPLLARITQEANTMKEAEIFESWINNLTEGTWALPETPEQKQELIDLMTKELPVGPDATNATEQLYNVFGDDQLFDALQELADADANADARSVVMTRMQELSDRSPDLEVVLGQLQTTSPVQPAAPEPDEMATDVAGDEQLPQSVEEGAMKQQMHRDAETMSLEDFLSKYPDDAAFWHAVNDVNEGWKETVAGAALAASMALGGAGHAQAADLSGFSTPYLQQVASSQHPRPMISVDDAKAELQARADGKQQTVSTPSASTNKGFSKEYLQSVVNGTHPRPMVSAERAQELLNQMNESKCNMTEAGEYCPKHGLEECGIYEYTGNVTNFGLEEGDELARLKKLALNK